MVSAQSLMEWAGARKMGAEKLHLIREYVMPLKIDVLSMGRDEGDGKQLHACGFRGTPCLVIIASDTGSDHVVPVIGPPLAQGSDMIP